MHLGVPGLYHTPLHSKEQVSDPRKACRIVTSPENLPSNWLKRIEGATQLALCTITTRNKEDFCEEVDFKQCMQCTDMNLARVI